MNGHGSNLKDLGQVLLPNNEQFKNDGDSGDGEELPMFPPSENIGLTFKSDGLLPLLFFVLPPEGDLQRKEFADLKHMLEKGGAILAPEPSNNTYNICYTEETLIPQKYESYKIWYTADLIRRCMDCQCFDEDIVEAEMILVPNFRHLTNDSVNHEDEWCLDQAPSLNWSPQDLFFSTDLLRPIMRISGSEYRKLISGSQLQADPAGSQGTRIGVDGVDVEMEGNNSNHAPVVKLEDIIDESTTPPLADALVLNAPRTEILHRPSHRALQVYIQNRQKWQNLIDRLPHHEVVYLQRVTDLLSGDFDEVYHQVSYHGDDYDAINSQPGRWNSVHDVYLTDVTESKELAQYSVEQKFNRKKYLEETLTVNKVAEWLANFQPTKYGHPIHTITSHQTLTNY